MEKFIDSGFKLNYLFVYKSILSEDEKNLFVKCSTNVHWVCLDHPLMIDQWISKHKIEEVEIDINRTFVSKYTFENFVLPWILLAKEFELELQKDTNFIDDICEWLRGSNFKKLEIRYRGKSINNIEKLKKLKKGKKGEKELYNMLTCFEFF